MSSKVVTSLMAESILLSKVGQVISGYSPITVLLIGSLVLFLVVYNKRRSRLVKYIEKIPGPAAMPFLGKFVVSLEPTANWFIELPHLNVLKCENLLEIRLQ